MNKKKLLALLMALVMTLTLVPVTAFADDVTPSASTTGYNGEKLPEGPANMDGNVIDVNATNAQYVLDGAYGDINGKTINFTENVTDALDLARPTKYSGSGTTSTGNTYSRTLNNVTFTANSGVELAGFYFHPGHIYGNDDFTKYNYVEDRSVTSTNDGYYRHSTLSKITFSGLTVKGSATTAPFDFIGSLDNATVSEITFNGCTITNDNGNAIQFNNNGNLRYGTITISNCNINGSGMGVYVNSAGDGTIALNNNIIFGGSNNAIQITRLSDGTGSVSITGNYLKSNKYTVNLNNYTSETITLTGNAVVAGTRGHLGHFKGDASGNFWAPQGTTLTENNTVTTTLSSPTADTQADQGENEITCSSAFDTALLNTSADKWVTLSNSASNAVAKIGTTEYATLQAAIDAAQNGATITLLTDVLDGSGLIVRDGQPKNITIDFNKHTYTMKDPSVGSTGTETQALHFSDNSTVTLKNGTFRVAENAVNAKMLMQNYAALTIEDMVIDGTSIAVGYYGNTYTGEYAIFNGTVRPQFNFNRGSATIRNSTISLAGDVSICSPVSIDGSTVIRCNKIVTKGTDERFADVSCTITIENGAKFSDDGVATILASAQTLSEKANDLYTVIAKPTYVAQIGDNQYTTLAAAVAAADTDATTIQLIGDITGMETVTIDAGQEITLDLNGHTIATRESQTGRHYYAIDNYGTFTLKDSAGNGKIEARGIENLGSGTMTIEGGKIVAIDANGGAAIWNEATLEFKSGTLEATYSGDAVGNGGPGCLNNRETGTAHIYSGTFTDASVRCYAIINLGNLTIEDVTVSGVHGALACDTGTLVVNGGSYTAKNYYGCWVTNNSSSTSVIINGGSFKGGSVGGYGLYADVDDGGQDVGNAAVLVTKGYFEPGKAGAAAFAKGGRQSNNVWKLCATGGVFKGGIDASYVADGYEAVLLSSANGYGGEGEDYNGWYKVGKVQVSGVSVTGMQDNGTSKTYTYTAPKTVVATDENNHTLSSTNNVSIVLTTNLIDDASRAPITVDNIENMSDFVATVTSKTGGANQVNVTIQVAKSGAEPVENTITYEVHPEAIISVTGQQDTTVALTNEQIQGTFTFKLSVAALNAEQVTVVHKHANGTSENMGTFKVDTDGNITLTVSSFSEFDISAVQTETDDGTYFKFEGASLRRRVLKSKRTEVVRSSTDVRFGYVLKNYDDNKTYYFQWSTDGIKWSDAIEVTKFGTVSGGNYDGYTEASLVITNVPDTSFTTTIYTRIYAVDESGTHMLQGEEKSVQNVITSLKGLAETDANRPWIRYAEFLDGDHYGYTLSYDPNNNYKILSYEVLD